jgi:mevalonate kinase
MAQNPITFYSHGKLLLTAEYLVLKGAKALALPLNVGQFLTVEPILQPVIEWETYEHDDLVFTATFELDDFEVLCATHPDKALYISNLLKSAQKLSSLGKLNGTKVTAKITFNMQWGLGSSSTLINNIAQWFKVDAFILNRSVSKGSGYDIACAQTEKPIVFSLQDGRPIVQPVAFKPPFLSVLNVLYLNQKMATEKNISTFLSKKSIGDSDLQTINNITTNLLLSSDLNEFMTLLKTHEALTGQIIGEIPVQQSLFRDFDGQIKSLGAWGGDFVLVASPLSFQTQKSYFEQLGYHTFFPLSLLLPN